MEKFESEITRKLAGGTRAICLMGMGGVALFIPADYLLAAELFPIFLPVRLAFILLCALVYRRASREPGPGEGPPFLIIFSAAAMIMVFMHFMGSAGELYFRGLIMCIFAAALVLPWRTSFTVGLGIAITVLFCGAGVLSRQLNSWFLVDIFFLLATTGFAAVWTRVSRDFREKEFLAAERIRESNLKLAEMDRLKSDFIANISHELRTPLTLILSPLQSLIQGKLDEASREPMLRGMQRSAFRLLSLMNQLLDFSRLDAGVEKLRVQETDLARALRELKESLFPAASARDIALNTDIQAPRAPAYADIAKLEKILGNLASNALKFSEPGGEITLELRESKDEWEIRVRDTGIGIPPDRLEAVFERFIQVESDSARKYEGTGIGLALARELTRMHGGRIKARSPAHPEKGGTEFMVFWPKGREHLRDKAEIIPADEQAATIAFPESPVPATTPASKPEADQTQNRAEPEGEARVLIVEDNEDLRVYLSELLSTLYVVHCASNGREALRYLEYQSADIVLTDMMMPEMDGYELTRRIRAGVSNPPVLMLTAKADMAHKLEGLECGVDDYLIKPFDPRELLARIRVLLELTRRGRIIAERNRVIEDELDMARMLQARLLPERLPASDVVDIEAVYEPMDKVGGDLYDVHAPDEDRVSVFVADVTGHGIPGALLGGVVKTALEYARETAEGPADLLRLLNERVLERTVTSYFVTALYAEIDLRNLRVRAAHAGHERLLVHHADGSLIEAEGEGLPLGILSDTEFLETEFAFAPGARFIFHSDGITETENKAREMFGPDRFRDFIRSGREQDAREFAEALIHELRGFRGEHPLRDDLTLLVVDVPGGAIRRRRP